LFGGFNYGIDAMLYLVVSIVLLALLAFAVPYATTWTQQIDLGQTSYVPKPVAYDAEIWTPPGFTNPVGVTSYCYADGNTVNGFNCPSVLK